MALAEHAAEVRAFRAMGPDGNRAAAFAQAYAPMLPPQTAAGMLGALLLRHAWHLSGARCLATPALRAAALTNAAVVRRTLASTPRLVFGAPTWAEAIRREQPARRLAA